MSLDVQVWALGRGGAPDVALPDLGDYSVTPISGDVGSVSLDYPRDGRGFAALRAVQTEDRPVEVEVRTDGTSAIALRFLLFTAAGDDIKPGATWTFTGSDLGVLLRDHVLPYNSDLALGGAENGETSFSANAGVVMRTLMQRAQAAGYVFDIGFGSFTNTLDSRGQAWASTAVVTLSPGTDLVGVLRVLADAGLCDWEVTNGRQLRLYNPGTRGTDRSLPGPGQLTLEHGRDIADAPVRHDVTEARTHLTTSGKDGLYSSAANPTALARIGWRRGGYRSFGNIADQGSLDAATQLAATTGGDGAAEQTHGLILESASIVVPGRDFQLGDWLLRGVNGATTRRQVVRYALNRKGREITAAVTLGDLIAARAARVQRQIDALANGSTVTGTSVSPPDVDDGKAPAAPTGVTGNSLAYYDGGTPLAQVTAAWLAVVTNDDGTAIGDLSGYTVEFRYQAGQNLPTDWQIAGLTSATSLRWSPVVQGRAIDVRVLAYDRYDRESVWSATFSLTTATDAAAPPVPSTPAPYSHLGLLVVPWNGRGSAGEAMSADFSRVEVHTSTTSNFTVDRPANLALSTTYVDELRGAGELPIDVGAAGYGTAFYVKLVSVDRTGNASAASAQGSAVLARVADGDIAAVSIGKLTVGIMNAIMTVSGIIRTAAAGARVELDTAGLRCIAADGRVLFEFSIPASLLTIVGRLIAGMGVGLGATVVIDPVTAAVVLYPNATTRRVRMRAFVGTDPGGLSNVPQMWIETLDAVGVSDGPVYATSGTNVWLFHRNGSSIDGARVFLGGPGEGNGAILAYFDSNVDAFVRVYNNGFIKLDSDAADIEINAGNRIFAIADSDIRLEAGAGSQVIIPNNDLNVPIGRVNARRFASGGNGAGIEARAGADIFFYWGGGVLNIGSGTSFVKTFVIDHPTDPDRWLVHGCTEGPSAGLEYHGVADVNGHAAVVELPAYFDAAARADGRQVQLTVVLPAEPDDVPGISAVAATLGPASLTEPGALDPGTPGMPPVPEWARLPVVAAGPIVDGRFRIACSAPTARVAWRVFAVRADVAPFDVEPLRADVEPHGDGPYRYLTRRAA